MKYKVKIKLLTPLHIGDGNFISPMEYFISDKKVYLIPGETLFKGLDRRNLDVLKTWLKTSIYRASFKRREAFRLSDFIKQHRYMENRLKKLSTLSFDIGSNDIQIKEIITIIKSNGEPYIPGSEIKGAIRTAILYRLLRLQQPNVLIGEIRKLQKEYGTVVKRIKNNRSAVLTEEEKQKYKVHNSKELFKKLSKQVINISKELEKTVLGRYKYYDVMRSLIISDTNIMEKQNLKIGEVNLINSNKKSQWIEYLENIEFEFSIFINDQLLKAESNIMNTPYRKPDIRFLDINFIKEALFDYSKDIIKSDQEILKNNKSIEKLISQNTESAPLIRLGKFKGYLSNTVSLIIKKEDPELYNDFFVYLLQAKVYDHNKTKLSFPKTRKLLNNQPLGWCKLQFEGV